MQILSRDPDRCRSGACTRVIADTAVRAFRKIVFLDDKHFPFVAVRILDPGFVLDRVAAIRVHLVARIQPLLVLELTHGKNVVG